MSVAALTGLAIYNTVAIARRRRAVSVSSSPISHAVPLILRGRSANRADDVARLEKAGDAAVAKTLAAAQPVQSELSELGALMAQLAQTVASLEIASRSPPVQERRRLQPSASASAQAEAAPAWKPILRPELPVVRRNPWTRILMFEMAYPTLRSLGVDENENVAALTELGYRLSVDHVDDLRFDAAELAARKAKYLKVAASVLLNKGNQATAKIHLADLSGFLTRFGIDLIAEKIETHVVDLFDFDVKLGQGNLFSPPRPIRPESMAEKRSRATARRLSIAPAPVIRTSADRPDRAVAGSRVWWRASRGPAA